MDGGIADNNPAMACWGGEIFGISALACQLAWEMFRR
jgi:hypothetical protein